MIVSTTEQSRNVGQPTLFLTRPKLCSETLMGKVQQLFISGQMSFDNFLKYVS